ncbi:Ectoine hydroxylase-related dioxygenase, phytanoyl-CoA dioxygenase (PhyH) family [Jannaschia faecimaris]|uniref:Ectoine hydroxylase-related dioxygenase, phytanoyl-CoA dioxygenase (PhyH) family n=1 Tax=Jannaschia faecimaris TaxID=1244108 RepID=A0A1H3NK81_9RHOB|nr:phytanoyl-CoA dioxygenase family protein [Jannaschia faecimaris]SDY89336.1 Ectoine hydroxylase-related dioxygenase, phytanoyl-CoA dioxygenase (PhyH) family [Jannaschia faecimaris]
MTLTPDRVQTFHRQGYLVVEDVLSTDLLNLIETEYADVLRGLSARWGLPWKGFFPTLHAMHLAGHDWFQPMDISLPGDEIAADTPFHAGPAVFELLTSPALLDIAEALLGPEVTSTPIQHLRIKPPARDLVPGEARAHVGGTLWHQDRGVAHAEADATDMITVWVAMTDATEENGCLIVQPFADDDGGAQSMLPHCPLSQTAIPKAHLDPARARALPVRRGGVVLLHPMVPHASLDNLSDGFRWSFDLRYQVTGQPTGRAHFPAFVARSRAHPASELHDWRHWRRLWGEARLACAARDHIPIHRWTSDSPHCA